MSMVFFTSWQKGGGKLHSLSNILYHREFYLLKLISKHYESHSWNHINILKLYESHWNTIQYWHRTVPKYPWHKAQCCAQHCTSRRSRMRPLTQRTDFRSTTWDSNSTQTEKKKYRESRGHTVIFLDWPVQLLNRIFLMVGNDWGGWGELENVLPMIGAHWEGQESTEMLPLKTKEWLMKTGTSGYSGKYPCLNAKMRAKITIGL